MSEQPVTHPPADLESDERPDDGGSHYDDYQHRKRDVPPACEHAAEDYRDLTRQDEADEDRRLAENQCRDHEVRNPAVQAGHSAGQRIQSGVLPRMAEGQHVPVADDLANLRAYWS